MHSHTQTRSRPVEAWPQSQTLHQLTAVVVEQLAPDSVPRAQWPAIALAALQHGLAPMLSKVMQGSGMDPGSIENGQALVDSAQRAAANDMLYEISIRDISFALAAAAIPAIWLKGADLARTAYPQSSLRPMGDLDVLVPYAQCEAALSVLRQLGYGFSSYNPFRGIPLRGDHRPDDNDEAYLKHLAHRHYVLVGGISNSVVVELHYGLSGNRDNSLLSSSQIQWFFENTRSFGENDELTFTGLSPEANLLYLAAHNIYQHSEVQAYLLRDLDVHFLICRNSLNWDQIIDQAVVLGWTLAVYRTLERAAGFYATPIPEGVQDQLAIRMPRHEDPSYMNRKRWLGHRWEDFNNTFSHMPARAKIRFALDKLFPSPPFMRCRYAVPAERPIWPYYLYRWYDLFRIILCVMLKRLRKSRIETP